MPVRLLAGAPMVSVLQASKVVRCHSSVPCNGQLPGSLNLLSWRGEPATVRGLSSCSVRRKGSAVSAAQLTPRSTCKALRLRLHSLRSFGNICSAPTGLAQRGGLLISRIELFFCERGSLKSGRPASSLGLPGRRSPSCLPKRPLGEKGQHVKLRNPFADGLVRTP